MWSCDIDWVSPASPWEEDAILLHCKALCSVLRERDNGESLYHWEVMYRSLDLMGFPGDSGGKESLPLQGMQIWLQIGFEFPWRRKRQPSVLAWEVLEREAWRIQSTGSQRVEQDLVTKQQQIDPNRIVGKLQLLPSSGLCHDHFLLKEFQTFCTFYF